MLGPSAAFNLIGLPATEIPLGLGRDGLPRGVQAIAAPDRDHVTIAVAEELERAFGGWVEPPSYRAGGPGRATVARGRPEEAGVGGGRD